MFGQENAESFDFLGPDQSKESDIVLKDWKTSDSINAWKAQKYARQNLMESSHGPMLVELKSHIGINKSTTLTDFAAAYKTDANKNHSRRKRVTEAFSGLLTFS